MLTTNQEKSFVVLANMDKCDNGDVIQDILELVPKSAAAAHLPLYERIFEFYTECGKYPDIHYLRHHYPDYNIPDFTGTFTYDLVLDFVQSIRKEVKIQEAEEALSGGDYLKAVESLSEIRHHTALENFKSEHARLAYDVQASEGVTGVFSNIHCLDQFVRGFMYGTLTIVGAPPSMFKTTFAVNTCYASLTNGFKCLFITLEIQKKNLLFNFWARHAAQMGINLPAELIHKASVSKENIPLLDRVQQDFDAKYGHLLFLIDSSDMVSFDDIAIVQRLEEASSHLNGLDVLFLDYIQLVRNFAPPKTKKDSTEFVNGVISRFNSLSKNFGGTGFIGFLLSQINREGMKLMNKSDGKKGMAVESLAEFNALERDGHYVILLYSSPLDRSRNVLYLQLIKNRTGPVHAEPVSVSVLPDSLVIGIRQEGQTFGLDDARAGMKEQLREMNEKLQSNGASMSSMQHIEEAPIERPDFLKVDDSGDSLDG